MQVRVECVRAILEFLAHVGVDHAHDAVHQNLHLPGDAEQEQREAPDDDIRVDELLAHHRDVVVLDETTSVGAAPAAEAPAAGLDIQAVDEEVLGFVVAVLFEPLHERLRGDKRPTAFVLRACDHHENLLLFCHAPKFKKLRGDNLAVLGNQARALEEFEHLTAEVADLRSGNLHAFRDFDIGVALGAFVADFECDSKVLEEALLAADCPLGRLDGKDVEGPLLERVLRGNLVDDSAHDALFVLFRVVGLLVGARFVREINEHHALGDLGVVALCRLEVKLPHVGKVGHEVDAHVQVELLDRIPEHAEHLPRDAHAAILVAQPLEAPVRVQSAGLCGHEAEEVVPVDVPELPCCSETDVCVLGRVLGDGDQGFGFAFGVEHGAGLVCHNDSF